MLRHFDRFNPINWRVRADECCILGGMEVISIGQIEAAINRARQAAPASGHEATLSADVAALANIYGSMIYHHQDEVAMATLDAADRHVLLRWI